MQTLNYNTMKKTLHFSTQSVWKGSLMLISYFLFAACMQHDESLAPNNADLSAEELNSEAGNGSLMKRTFTAHLNSGNEVPPAGTTVESNGQGQVIFKLSKDGTTLDYKLIVANIENITQAHIHCGAAGVNGAVVVFLYGFNATGITTNGILAEGSITSANVIPRADGANCVGGLMTFEDLIGRLQNGTAYVNVHTLKYPGGEIRGQIQ